MKYRSVSPLRPVKMICVLRETGEVDDSEVRTARRPSVRSRLADIVEACPDVLSADEIVISYELDGLFMSIALRNMAIII